MNNENNSSYKINPQHLPHPSSRDAQRPLIDVARSYCKNLNPSTSRDNSITTPKDKEMKENVSLPVSDLGYSAFPSHKSPYTWQAATNSGQKPPVPANQFPKGSNPYSWKASSKKTDAATRPSENVSSSDSSFPRPPRIQLPKLEPLTVSISKSSESRSVSEFPQQSPLQPFSPTGNSRECTCHRNPKVILCQSCGLIQKGRLSMACTVHPRQVFLMDINCCSGCKSTSLKEICDAKKP